MGRPIVILSPHLDDALLSCWNVLTSPADVLAVNVFAGAPPPGVVGWWDRLSGLDSAEAMQLRLEEDRQALAHAGREALNLDFLDTQYREGSSDPAAIASAVRGAIPAGALVYAPAGIALHDDHVDVRSAALMLDNPLVLYADLPHASARGWPAWVAPGSRDADEVDALWTRAVESAGLEPLERRAHVLAPEAVAAKLEAVREYRSQVPVLETAFGAVLDPAGPLAHEAEWRLPAQVAG